MSKKKKNAIAGPEPALKRYDHPGHLDPAHAERLLELSRAGQEEPEDSAFLRAMRRMTTSLESWVRRPVASMTSGDGVLTGELEAEVEEEVGGPFVETSATEEFAAGTDESNTPDATREPTPLPNPAPDDPNDPDDPDDPNEPKDGKL